MTDISDSIQRAFNEALHKRGTGAQGGQFVSSDGTKSKSLGYNGKQGSGYGRRGGDSNVRRLQRELNRLGITDSAGKPLAVDGKFGPKTTAAVKRLQRKLGLPSDGKITPALLARIKRIKKVTARGVEGGRVPAGAGKPKKAARGGVVAPDRSAAPAAKKANPSAAKKAAPAAPRHAPARRSLGYSDGMTDIDRHAMHNQKSHGNRLGRPENVPGKTGLAKAAGDLADKPKQGPEQGPERVPESDFDIPKEQREYAGGLRDGDMVELRAGHILKIEKYNPDLQKYLGVTKDGKQRTFTYHQVKDGWKPRKGDR